MNRQLIPNLKRIIYLTIFILISCCTNRSDDWLKSGFTMPPDSARPGVYWYFFGWEPRPGTDNSRSGVDEEGRNRVCPVSGSEPGSAAREDRLSDTGMAGTLQTLPFVKVSGWESVSFSVPVRDGPVAVVHG